MNILYLTTQPEEPIEVPPQETPDEIEEVPNTPIEEPYQPNEVPEPSEE
jgi:hypothetical protein